MSNIINAQVTLNKKKSLDKAYFEKAWNKFNREFLKSGVVEELRLKRCFYKPSMFKKIRKEITRNKWKFYR